MSEPSAVIPPFDVFAFPMGMRATLVDAGYSHEEIDAALARARREGFNDGVEAVAVASASCPLPKPYYRGELARKIRACKLPTTPPAAPAQPAASTFCDLWQNGETGRLLELPMHAASPGPHWAIVRRGCAPAQPAEGEREAFEAWLRSTDIATTHSLVRGGDRYIALGTQQLWAAWKARAGRRPA